MNGQLFFWSFKQKQLINGHFRNLNWRYLPYIRPIFPLKFPLNWGSQMWSIVFYTCDLCHGGFFKKTRKLVGATRRSEKAGLRWSAPPSWWWEGGRFVLGCPRGEQENLKALHMNWVFIMTQKLCFDVIIDVAPAESPVVPKTPCSKADKAWHTTA